MTVLAELLNQRKAAFERLHEAQVQIAKSAVVEQPDLTDEVTAATEDLINEVEATAIFIQTITVAINYANNRAVLSFEDKQMTLMEAIALRDRLQLVTKQRTTTLDEIETALGVASGKHRWYSTRERRNKDDIREVSAIDLKAFRAATKRSADRVRALDIEIQKVNWSFEA